MYLNCNILFTSESMSLKEIESLVGFFGDEGKSKGDKRLKPNGEWLGTYYNFSYLSLYTPRSCNNIEEALENLLDKVRNKQKNLYQFYSLSKKNCATIKIFLSDFNHASIFLNKKFLKEINYLGIEIDIDIYGS